jgi:hypothetical protein
MKSAGRNLTASIGLLTIALWASMANAAPPTEELCEKVYAGYLLKAQKALSEDKPEDALRFLLEAQAMGKTCGDSSERPLPEKQIRESGHAFSRQHYSFS